MHLDMTTVFLNGCLYEKFYIQVSPKLRCKSNAVLKLKRTIYGLNQYVRVWNQRLNDRLLAVGYVKLKLKPCLYSRRKNKEQIFVAVFFDDFFIFLSSSIMTDNLKKDLMSNLKIKDIGQVKKLFGHEG